MEILINFKDAHSKSIMVNGLYNGCKNFAKTLEPIQNSRRQNRDMKQVLDDDPHVLDAILQKFDATATWRKVFAHSWFIPQAFSLFICTVHIKTDQWFRKFSVERNDDSE